MSQAFNVYDRQLSEEQIAAGQHRALIGGMWDELGQLQLSFLQQQGLLPEHALLDIGCGALRGGVRFIDYLDSGNYFGMDINASLIRAGRLELKQAGLCEKKPTLLVDDAFAFRRFEQQFDFAIAQSVFSHLPMNHIIRCLHEARHVMKPDGELFATFFEAPSPVFTQALSHGAFSTYFDRDPFHYALSEFEWMAASAGMTMRIIGEWGHPKEQKMLGFKVAK